MCGVTSRRHAEDLVREGRVRLNGVTVDDLATKVNPQRDKVFVDGRQIARVHDYVYLVLNKPHDTITTSSDERGRTTVMDYIHERRRVYPIGRLDRHTTGTLLLTDDGDFAHHLMHPRFEIPKAYRVTCDRAVTREDLAQLRTGVRLTDGVTAPAEALTIPGNKGRAVALTIHEGRNRQVRRMFEALGYDVEKLDRVAYGPVTLAGLPRGHVRRLTGEELRALRRLAGLSSTE
jgi:23S rRNA pseudouridine2605 synthase